VYIHKSLDSQSLQSGEIHFKIEKYAFTANNITYATLGNDLSYFNFFPAENRETEAIIPVWGIAKVDASSHPDITIGERFYGYFPMADSIKVFPGKVRENGFSDVTAHRTSLPAVYNFYSNLAIDEMHKKSFEDLELVFRPLFTTSFLLDDYLTSKSFFDSHQVLLTSASSKTAIALAYLLLQRKNERPNLRIIGLTSQPNYDFVKSLGCYDEVILYENTNAIPNETTLIVDFSGNQQFLSQINQQLGDQLKFISLVGLVQWENRKPASEKSLGTVFFAPHQVKIRSKEWGLAEFQKKVTRAWHEFMPFAQKNFQTISVNNAIDIEGVYLKNLEGKVSPNSAYVICHS
jgi:hypothetical protein